MAIVKEISIKPAEKSDFRLRLEEMAMASAKKKWEAYKTRNKKKAS